MVLRVYANPATERCDEINIEQFHIQGRNKGINGILIYGAVYTINFNKAYILGTNRAVDVDSDASGIVPFNLHFERLEVDRATSNAVVLTKCKDVTFERPEIANTSGVAAEPPGGPQGGADGDVFTAGSGVEMLRVINGRLGNGRARAMNLAASSVFVHNMRFNDVSEEGAGVHPMVYLSTLARDVHFHTNRFEGFSRASYAIQAENAVTGSVLDNSYKNMVSGFNSYGGSTFFFSRNNSL